MRRSFFVGLIAAFALGSSTAGAWEPPDDGGVAFPDPVEEPRSEPQVFDVPEGLYYVTDTYVTDVTSTDGRTTTYSTETVHESTGSYARVIDVVGTGGPSAFDGTSFNGRAAFGDGTPVAGTYYENFVLTDQGYVSVSIVFFQDDSVTVIRPPQEAVAPNPPASTTPAETAPATPPETAATTPPQTAATPPPSDRPTTGEQPSPPEREPVVETARAGVALAADGPTLSYAEVLRGRQIRFWPRAFVGGAPATVTAWRLVSAVPDHVSATAGGAEPLVAQWLRMPTPAETIVLVFEISTDVAPGRVLSAAIAVVVRSPALVD